MSEANRGKVAEKKVKDKLLKMESGNCAHMRMPDAHAGSRVSTLADFIFCKEGTLTLLEVKETKLPNRLPYQNVDKAQVGKMRMWKAAGARAWVITYHSTLDKWRFFEIDYFLQRDPEKPSGSWDFSEVPLYTLDEIFQQINYWIKK